LKPTPPLDLTPPLDPTLEVNAVADPMLEADAGDAVARGRAWRR
jgi:hypothetical protein